MKKEKDDSLTCVALAAGKSIIAQSDYNSYDTEYEILELQNEISELKSIMDIKYGSPFMECKHRRNQFLQKVPK